MRLPRLSPATYSRIALVAVVMLVTIILTGAAVRLTGSGLGCTDWPTCEEGRLVAPLEFNPMVEFVNRVFTGFVSASVIVAVLGSLLRTPRRRDLTWWSLGLVAGVLAQALLGGLVVIFHLKPPFVMAHFLLSLVLVWNALVLQRRASQPDGPPRRVVSDRAMVMLRWLYAGAWVVAFTGTVVTATGPHGGDETAERFDFELPDVARVHGISVIAFTALAIAVVVLLTREGAPERVRHTGRLLLGAILVQATIGYVQYFSEVPALLVFFHIAGAVAVFSLAVQLNLVAVERGGAVADATGPPPTGVEAGDPAAEPASLAAPGA